MQIPLTSFLLQNDYVSQYNAMKNYINVMQRKHTFSHTHIHIVLLSHILYYMKHAKHSMVSSAPLPEGINYLQTIIKSLML